jgi:type I restriction enzyme S subunit
VAQPTLNIRQIKTAPIIRPPREAQAKFAQVVRRELDLHSRLMGSFGELDALTASLTQRAFRGEL